MVKRKNLPINERHLAQIYLCFQVPFSIQLYAFRVLSFPVSPVILLQYPFEIRGLVKDLAGKLGIGDDLPVAIVLQGAGADVESFTYFLAREEVFTAEEWPVRLGYIPNPFLDASQG